MDGCTEQTWSTRLHVGGILFPESMVHLLVPIRMRVCVQS
jgi:hypothetical protein